MILQKQHKGYIEGGYKIFFLDEQKEQSIDYHYHDFHKCIIIYQGNLTYTVEGKDYDLAGGHVIWVPAYTMHKVIMHSNISYKRSVVYLSDQFVQALSSRHHAYILSMSKTFDNSMILSQSHWDSLRLTYPYETRENNPLKQLSMFLDFMDIYFKYWVDAQNSQTLPTVPKTDDRIHLMKTYIQDNLTEPLKVQDIASEFYMDRYYLMHAFKTQAGITLHQYILQERLKFARNLMKTENTLTEIAFQSGFNNYTTFSRAFKKFYQMSPRDYLSMHPSDLLSE